jgi:hypothetical protein
VSVRPSLQDLTTRAESAEARTLELERREAAAVLEKANRSREASAVSIAESFAVFDSASEIARPGSEIVTASDALAAADEVGGLSSRSDQGPVK